MFKLLDFAIFALFLAMSIAVGLYHGVKSQFSKFKHSKTDEYLTGGHSLPVFPVCLSLVTTFISGLSSNSMKPF